MQSVPHRQGGADRLAHGAGSDLRTELDRKDTCENVAIRELPAGVYPLQVEALCFEEGLDRDGEQARYAIGCSSGTYVRSLVADLGDAYCLELRRTAIGPFDVADAQDPDEPPEAWRVLPLLDLLRVVMPIVPVDAETATRAGYGQRFALDDAPAEGRFALVHDDDPIAIAEREPDGRTHPVVGFRS